MASWGYTAENGKIVYVIINNCLLIVTLTKPADKQITEMRYGRNQ